MTSRTTGKDGKTYKLTLKQENFCRAYLECEGNASAAYRQVYGCEGWTEEAVWCAASKLMSNAKVQQRVKELQQQARERHNVTVDSLSKRLDDSFEVAKGQDNSGQMTQATMGQAKLHGLLVDRTEDVTKVEDMTPDERTAELARVQAELDALERPAGLKVSDGPTEH